jgi:hypothetical protein
MPVFEVECFGFPCRHCLADFLGLGLGIREYCATMPDAIASAVVSDLVLGVGSPAFLGRYLPNFDGDALVVTSIVFIPA